MSRHKVSLKAFGEIFVKQRKGIGKVVNHNNLVLTKSDYP